MYFPEDLENTPFNGKMLVVMVSINFSWISHHFDVLIVCVAELDHTYHRKNIGGST